MAAWRGARRRTGGCMRWWVQWRASAPQCPCNTAAPPSSRCFSPAFDHSPPSARQSCRYQQLLALAGPPSRLMMQSLTDIAQSHPQPTLDWLLLPLLALRDVNAHQAGVAAKLARAHLSAPQCNDLVRCEYDIYAGRVMGLQESMWCCGAVERRARDGSAGIMFHPGALLIPAGVCAGV